MIDAEDQGLTPVWRLVREARDKMEPVEKRGTAPNVMGGFKFKRINDVLAKLDPVLEDVGVFYFPRVRSFEQRDIPGSQNKVQHHTTVHIDLVWKGPAGDELVMDGVGEAIDSFDKGVGKATTNAVKNTIGVWLAQPTVDLEESDIDGHTADEHVEDPYASPEQYERVKAAVGELGEDERQKVVGPGSVLGVKVTEMIDGKRMIVMRESEVQPLLDRLADLKVGYDQDEGPQSSADAKAEDIGAPEGAGAPVEKYGYETWTHKDLDQLLGDRGLSTTGNITQKAMRLRAWDSTNQAEGYTEPEEAPF